MTRKKFVLTLPALCAALLLAACGGEGGSTPQTPATLAAAAATTSTPTLVLSATLSSMDLKAPEQGLQPMAGYSNLGNTSYANSALKFLIHSIGPLKLKQHLAMVAMEGDDGLQGAAASFMQLIDSTNTASGPTPEEMSAFLALLQQLPAFQDFTLVGHPQDAGEFLNRMSQAFALHTRYDDAVTLNDDNNAAKTGSEYWTILRPASADDSLQDLFDRTPPAAWKTQLSAAVQHLTVSVQNMAYDAQGGTRMLGTEKFDFNQNVYLRITNGDETQTLTLEPREVIAFHGTDANGHYEVYAKDDQWVGYSDGDVTVVGRMPSVENVRFINFAIRSIESKSATFSEAAPPRKLPALRFGSNPREQFPA